MLVKEKIYNKDNLKIEEIDEVVIRVKVLLKNKKNKILLGFCNNTYQFTGGHLEDNESIIDCINREVKEETGIELDLERLDPFFVIRHFTKNYRGTNKNRVSEIYYFAIENNSEINLSNVDYTKAEKEGKFELRYIDLDNIEGVLEESISWNKKNKIIVEEMLLAINEYKLLLK